MSLMALSNYAMGYSDRERRRLSLQGAMINPITDQLLRRAGVSSGMRVLDVGCGVGEVAFIAARLVGPLGHVTAIDVDESALAIGRRAAQELEMANITFMRCDVTEFSTAPILDAVIGRQILLHLPDPQIMVRRAFEILKPRGLAVFQEYDFSVVHSAYPATPLRDQVFQLFREFFGANSHGNMGTRLFQLFVDSGFPHPQARGEYSIEGGSNSLFYELCAESARSILPRAEALGLVRAADFDVDTLAARLRKEAMTLGSGLPNAPLIGCFAHKP